MNSLKEILLSDKNIYKAILSMDSYIPEIKLMEEDDLQLYYKLKDKFNYKKHFVEGFISEVKKVIKEVLDKDDMFFSTKVYFKIKNPTKGIYRPIHVTSLKNTIAIVSMLQILIFDMDDNIENDMKFSNLSKIIPSNFYGNIPSKSPEKLFERWQDKYKEYAKNANEKFAQYEENEKFQYEVTLDLENFFPSINPLLVYDFIVKTLKVRFLAEDLELIKKITFKLLYFKIEEFEEKGCSLFKKLYYSDSGKSQDFEEIKIGGYYITKGIPQGLPQSYFFGNLIMINVANIYCKYFGKGDSLYYVDDSYIYTNIELDENDKFKTLLKELNISLKSYSKVDLDNIEKFPYKSNYKCLTSSNVENYIIKVHEQNKSSYISVKDEKTGYKYLKFLSRLASMGSFDINSTFSDIEEIQIKKKFKKLIEAINKEIEISCHLQQRKKRYRCDTCEDICENKKYVEKLKRFKKFFQFRVLIIEIKESNEVIEEIEKQLESLKHDEIEEKLQDDLFEIKLNVLYDYLMNIMDDFNESSFNNKKLVNIYKKMIEFETDIYIKTIDAEGLDKTYFYYYKLFYYKNKIIKDINPYKSIVTIISKKISLNNKHSNYVNKYLKEVLENIKNETIIEYAFDICSADYTLVGSNIDQEKKSNKYSVYIYWSNRCEYLKKYVMNTIISLILNVDLNNNLYIAPCSQKPLNYFDLRLLTAVRNKKIDLKLISRILNEYIKCKQVRNLDYSVFEAIYYFKKFIVEPKYIDDLILIHKYTTELWENGSKYMHFYTLHNQSHAVELIKNINIFIKAIDYFKISKIDYYILYIACYLHDISMVMYPDQDKFMNKYCDESNQIYTLFLDKIDNLNLKGSDIFNSVYQQDIKGILLRVYKEIDNLFESEVRNNHAQNSSEYIRNNKDLLFINKAILDIVAEVSYSHGMDCRDIYYIKSLAKSRLISKKFMMILIRLADLFDISENRISIPIFDNNKNNMHNTSKFHWLSHLITGNFEIDSIYKIVKKDEHTSYFAPGTILEILEITININLNQLTTIDNNYKCNMIKMENYNDNSKEIILEVNRKLDRCCKENCNFICKWFMKKNSYMIQELFYLQNYLESVQSYFKTTFKIKLKLNDSNIVKSDEFDDIRKNIIN